MAFQLGEKVPLFDPISEKRTSGAKQDAEKLDALPGRGKKRQGTTSVVPITPIKSTSGFSPCKAKERRLEPPRECEARIAIKSVSFRSPFSPGGSKKNTWTLQAAEKPIHPPIPKAL
jgi:hypothetical protein